MTATVQTLSEYRDLPMDWLVESPTNPRQTFDEDGMQELAASIREHGVLQPLLVRPRVERRFEIVFGARRYRGALIAEKETIPVCIREMTDAQVLEAQLVENPLREGRRNRPLSLLSLIYSQALAAWPKGFLLCPIRVENTTFKVVLSVEKEQASHSTLLLRTFLRHFGAQLPPEYYNFLTKALPEPDWKSLYPTQWEAASQDALLLELGKPETDQILEAKIEELRQKYGKNTVLIGGPPCQAYSLVGRARNRGNVDYVAEDDPRHLLYEKYITILSRLRPVAFVMENVKGMLSSSLNDELIFERVLTDRSSRCWGGVQPCGAHTSRPPATGLD